MFLPGYDVGGPFLSVTAPIATASVFGTAVAGDVTVTGQADDNVAVASVKVQVNGGAFTSLTLTPPTLLPGNKQNFSQTLTGVLNVINGLNIVRIRATDTNGNTTDVVRNVRYTAKHNLTVAASGTAAAVTFIGKLPDLAAGSYQVGNLYTITAPQFDTGVATTATTASNSFSHWLVGSDTTHYTTRALTFTMSTDLITNPTLTAVYVANPFQSAVTIGTYSGLISVDAGYASTNATHGYLTATVSAGGVLTGSFKLNGILYTFISGNVANDGTVLFGATQALQVPYARFATNPALTATLKFDLVNKVLNGKVYDTTNVSTVVAPLQSATAGALAAGTYTFHLPTSTVPAITDFPQGDTVGTVTVAASGAVTGSITLADTKIGTFSTFVNSAGVFPLYVSPYGATATTTGSLSGLITVGATAGSELTNATNCKWFRPANAFLATGAYAAGWPNGVVVTLAGAKYNSAAAPLYTGAGTSNHASFFASGTGLSSTLTNLVDVSGTSFVKHTSTDTITFLFTSSTGILSGTRGTILYKGVVIQGGTQGIYGYFSTGTATTTGKQGSFTLVP